MTIEIRPPNAAQPADKQPPKTSFFRAHARALATGAASLALVAALAAQSIVAFPTPVRAQQSPIAPQPAAVIQPINPAVQAFSFADVVERVRPAVVSIRVKTEATNPRQAFEDMPDSPGGPLERFFRDFRNRRGQDGPGQQTPDVQMSQGSGFIISSDGMVVTNFHVVKGAKEVTVVTDDGNEYKAKVLGSDEKTDVALVKIDAKDKIFPIVPFAQNSGRVGDWVLAVGNPFGLGGTVTAGIVSARGREIGAGPYDDFLQIDAPINHGNSGGPTFNLSGEVVGVNTAIFSPSGGSVGIGFAIPVETVQRVIAQLEKTGEVVRGWLGVQIQPVTRDIADSLGMKDARGALVADVQQQTPAIKAGIKVGDAIIAVEGHPVRGPRDLARTIAGYEPGSTVKVTLVRNGKEQDVNVELGKLPSDQKLSERSKPSTQSEEPSSLADLGIAVAPANDVGAGTDGVAVVKIDRNSPAARRNLKVGDVILEVQGETVATAADVAKAVKDAKQDGRRSVLLRLKSGSDAARFVAVPLGDG
ncbi:MAG: Do family serine endopeptidase [Ancalomicrobiaceae bacterium]|nr:Do family serine endopeptidase [Ancalomicrobiaceae bacterium]